LGRAGMQVSENNPRSRVDLIWTDARHCSIVLT
jgi:hypothetical protein